MTVMFREDWAVAANCRGTGDVHLAEGAAQRRVRILCEDCPVRREGLAEALDDRIEWGVWGGMTERERRALLRRNPEVSSWREVLRSEPSPVR